MPLKILDVSQFNRSDTQPYLAGFEGKRPDPCQLDRVADVMLQQGFHAQAARLSFMAAELRAGGRA